MSALGVICMELVRDFRSEGWGKVKIWGTQVLHSIYWGCFGFLMDQERLSEITSSPRG